MRILLAVAALAVSCAGQEANCRSKGPITVCDMPPQTHKVCAPIEVRKATGQKCGTVVSQSKHWYAPISQSDNIRLREAGDRWTITALDGENCQQNGLIIVCDMPPQKHGSYIIHPKHYYVPASLTGTIHSEVGDMVQVTAFDRPTHYSQEVCSKDGKLIACSYESEKQTTGKLIDLQRVSTANGALRAQVRSVLPFKSAISHIYPATSRSRGRSRSTIRANWLSAATFACALSVAIFTSRIRTEASYKP